MFFSETHWTLPDMSRIEEEFDREYDLTDYERKIGGLAHAAQTRLGREKPGGKDAWNDAVSLLRDEDHYLVVLIDGSPAIQKSKVTDRIKLVLTAFAITLVILGGIIMLVKWRHD